VVGVACRCLRKKAAAALRYFTARKVFPTDKKKEKEKNTGKHTDKEKKLTLNKHSAEADSVTITCSGDGLRYARHRVTAVVGLICIVT